MPRVVAYTWAPGTAASVADALEATARIGVIEQATSPTQTDAKPLSPLPFWAPEAADDQLRNWAAQLSADAPAGTYTATYSATTRRVTIATTNATAMRPVLPEAVATWTGITQTLTGWATSWTGDADPGAVLECAGIEVEPITDWSQVDEKIYRHGRARFLAWVNHDVAKVTLYFSAARWGTGKPYCTTGRIRVYPDDAITTDYSYSDPTGIVDGYVVAAGQIEQWGDSDEWLSLSLVLAIARS